MGLRCKRCGAEEHVKNGLMRGEQRYRCKTCGLNFTDTPPRGMPLAMKVTAVLLYVSGLSMNRTAKLLGVSTPTVMAWIERFEALAAELFGLDGPVVLAGDYNIMPTDADVYKPERWTDDALFAPEVKAAYQRLLDRDWTDALRTLHPDERVFTFWDYFRNAFPRDAGLRIDHFLLNKPAAKRLRQAGVDRSVRAMPKTSDHAPVWIELE